MFKSATYTSRLVRSSHNLHHTSRTTLAKPTRLSHSPFSTSTTMSAKSTMESYKKLGNRENAPPKHEMVYFKGLTSEKRAFGDFRTVLHTGLFSQIVAMEVPVGGEIGDEVHTVDQILLFTSGRGLATVNGKDQEVSAGDVVVVPAGTQHQFVTKGDQPLELITVYSPAEHLPSSVHKTKEEGDKAEDEGVDEAPEWAVKSKAENEKSGEVNESGKY
ncbi:RmlC-like cupin domain-containing protein [Paraphoma chrysanthemicola]|uniref:RmlC-like cupin domain-containing protein n=1 Tax=Paraphoma chrysanthemicola TaxID=798071 RepID=A0A8K0W2V9_9PLEO|nr:RmlC-like cupin domain-containing protein [Paraphoma chrysanthemicola]